MFGTISHSQCFRYFHYILVPSPGIKIIVFSNTVSKVLLPECLYVFSASVDIDMIECNNEDFLVAHIQSDQKITHFILIKSSQYWKRLIDRIHCHENVNNIYIYCATDELKERRRMARNYAKLDAVFDDFGQILIKLLMDVALFCEESADRQRDKPSLAEFAHKNYQRSIDIYEYAEKILC